MSSLISPVYKSENRDKIINYRIYMFWLLFQKLYLKNTEQNTPELSQHN